MAADEEIEIDIRPMMNILIILIPFLVSLAVYTRLAVLELSLPPNVGAAMAGSSQKPTPKLTIVLTPGYLAITLGDQMLDSLPRISDDYDYLALGTRLLLHREQSNLAEDAIIAVRDNIPFKYVVKVMDVCRESGFAKMGLAAATQNPLEAQ